MEIIPEFVLIQVTETHIGALLTVVIQSDYGFQMYQHVFAE